MVLAKQEKQERSLDQEKSLNAVLGAAVYTEAGQLAGFVFEVCENCVGIALCGGQAVWLGKPMIACVEGRSVFLASNLLRKHTSLHMGIHVHKGTKPAGLPIVAPATYAVSQAG